jgi:hypothetical protein
MNANLLLTYPHSTREHGLGHVVRTSDDRIVKKVLVGKTDERRKSTKTEIKAVSTENDVKSAGVKIWRKKAEDRFVWAIILYEELYKL